MCQNLFSWILFCWCKAPWFWDTLNKVLERELFGGRNAVHGCMNTKDFLDWSLYFVSDISLLLRTERKVEEGDYRLFNLAIIAKRKK